MTANTLQYISDRDKAYGVAGMTITLVALDGEDYFSGIDLDAPAGEHVIMSHEYGFGGQPEDVGQNHLEADHAGAQTYCIARPR